MFLYFQHIHKAGGSTLCHILARSRNIKLGRHINCNLIKRLNPKNKSSDITMRSLPFDWRIQELEEFMISTGRNTIAAEDQPLASWWNLHDIKPMQLNDITKKWSFITIIRHPVERILSHYRFERLSELTNHTVFQWAKERPFHSQNYMVRMFSSMLPKHLPSNIYNQIDAIWPYFDHNPPSTGWDSKLIDVVTQDDLNRAKRVLNRFVAVINLDWLEECTPLLKRWLNIDTDDIRARYWWGSIQAPPSLKKSKRKKPSKIDYKELYELNSYDMELYEYAKMLCKCNAQSTYFIDSGSKETCINSHKSQRKENEDQC